MGSMNRLKLGLVAGILTVTFIGTALPSFSQDNVQEADSLQPEKKEIVLNAVEKQSRINVKGRDKNRPFHAYYVREAGATEPLLAKNENAVVHIASVSKMITAMAFYYCWEEALKEAVDEETRRGIDKMFQEKEPYVSMALIYSNNKRANEVGVFLEHLDFDFINKAVEEQGIQRGRLRVFSKIIVPQALDAVGGIENTFMTTPSGLPPDNYEYRPWNRHMRGDQIPDVYKGSKYSSRSYRLSDHNRSTPKEIADIIEYILEHYPRIQEFMNTPVVEDTLSANFFGVHYNTNLLLEDSEHHFKGLNVPGVHFGKTGTTDKGGKSIVWEADRSNVTIIGDDFGHRKASERNAHSVELIEAAFAMLEPKVRAGARRDSLALVKKSQWRQDSLQSAFAQARQDSLAYVDLIRTEVEKEMQTLSLEEIDSVLHEIDSALQILLAQEDLNPKFQKKKERLIRTMNKYTKILRQDSSKVEGIKPDEVIIPLEKN